MLLNNNFSEIDATTLDELVSVGAAESLFLEFKRESYGAADRDKREFLKDISALANTQGGHLIIGVDEDRGAAARITPIVGIDIDVEQTRLESMARAGLEPALAGLQIKRIGYGDGHVIVIYVPRSYNPPHRVTAQGSNRYWARTSTGTYELGLEELRLLFGQQSSMEERARMFVRQRALEISSGNGSVPIETGRGVLAFHVLPLLSFGARTRHSIERLRESFREAFVISGNRMGTTVNLEGLIAAADGRRFKAYTQVFRDGSIEFACSGFIYEDTRESTLCFPGTWLTDQLIEALLLLQQPYMALEISPPVLLSLSAFGIGGVNFERSNPYFFDPSPIERSEISLPSTVVSDQLS